MRVCEELKGRVYWILTYEPAGAKRRFCPLSRSSLLVAATFSYLSLSRHSFAVVDEIAKVVKGKGNVTVSQVTLT